MARSRIDPFTLSLFQRQPTAWDLISMLPLEVARSLLAAPPKSRWTQLEKLLAEQDPDEVAEIFERARILTAGSRLDPEDLAEIAQAQGVDLSRAKGTCAQAHAILVATGNERTRSLFEAALKPGEIQTEGTFAHFAGPECDVSGIDTLEMCSHLEVGLEAHFKARTGKPLLVKVRAEALEDRLLVAIYNQRLPRDGRNISMRGSDKRLDTRSFERSAASTYFTLEQREEKCVMLIRSPGTKLATRVRELVGQVLEADQAAFGAEPLSAYNLDALIELKALTIQESFQSTVGAVDLSEVTLRLATGNVITLMSRGRGASAVAELHELSQQAAVLLKSALVTSATFRFRRADAPRRVVAKAKVGRSSITLDEAHWHLVNEHLKAWGITS